MADRQRLVDPVTCFETLTSDDTARLLDVRSRSEFLPRHAARSVNIPLGRISPAALEQAGVGGGLQQRLFCICASGIRSVHAARQLRDLGYADVAVVEGGLRAWTARGLPVDAMSRPAPVARIVIAALLFAFTSAALAISGSYGLLATTTFGLAMVAVMPWRWLYTRADALVRGALRRRAWRRPRRVAHG